MSNYQSQTRSGCYYSLSCQNESSQEPGRSVSNTYSNHLSRSMSLSYPSNQSEAAYIHRLEADMTQLKADNRVLSARLDDVT